MLPDWLKFFNEYIPSMVGSASSLLWMEGSILRKLLMFFVGCYAGYHAGIYFNQLTDVPLTISCFTLGLYSVSLISKGYETIASMNFLDFIPSLKRKLGGDK